MSFWYQPENEEEAHIEVGEYMRLPDGKILLYKTEDTSEFVEVAPEEVVEGKRIINFVRYYPNRPQYSQT